MRVPTSLSTVYAAVHGARLTLAAAGVASPGPDAEQLAAHVLRVDVAELHRRMILREPLDAAAWERYADLVEERARRVPLQHLTGRAHFRHLELEVGPGVFIPRPETESVAGWAIDAVCRLLASGVSAPVVVDLCTGSGAIALALKDELPEADVHAVEFDPHAHAWAARNVARLGLQIDLRLGDARAAFEDLAGDVDVVVSNPPYIPADMVPLDPEVRDHDPALALYGGGTDGLAMPLAVAARAAYLLRPGGVLVMEHADTQGQTLPAALARTGDWLDIEDRRDLTGRPRAVVAARR